MYDDTAEILKPSIEVQKDVKKTIDDKQNKVIEQLQKNQLALTEGIGKNQLTLAEGILNSLKEIMHKEQSEEFGYPPPPEEFMYSSPAIEIPEHPKPPVPPKPHLDITKNFNAMDMEKIKKFNLTAPSNFIKMSESELLEEKNENSLKAKSIGS